MDFGKEMARDSFKSKRKATVRRKCQKRVDIAQKMASGCPNLSPKRAHHQSDVGHPGPYDGHRAGSDNKRKKQRKNNKPTKGKVPKTR